MEVEFVVQVTFMERFKGAGFFIEFEGFSVISEVVVADAEPNAG